MLRKYKEKTLKYFTFLEDLYPCILIFIHLASTLKSHHKLHSLWKYYMMLWNFAILFDYILISTTNHHTSCTTLNHEMLKNAHVFCSLTISTIWFLMFVKNEKRKTRTKKKYSCNQNKEFYQTNVWFSQNSAHLFST